MVRIRPELRTFLERDYRGAESIELTGDASQRRFLRLALPSGGTRVVMDYGKAFAGETDDLRLAAVFREARLPVAAVEAWNGPAGCLVLEDLGDRTLEAALAAAADPVPWLRAAVLLAVDVAVRGTPALARSDRADGPALDRERFRFEMGFFLEHFVGRLRRIDRPGPGLVTALERLADRAAETPRSVLCHRDFHSRNIMALPGGGLAMVDIQDARWGPDTYDLASLVYDAYIDLDPATRDRLVETYREALPSPPAEEPFRHRLQVVAAQRMIKALGTFGYQTAVAGRDRYADAIPRTLSRLRTLLPTSPDLTDLHHHLTHHSLLTQVD